ncbi:MULTISPECIES: phage head-tail connector protein [Clostridium]|uniref:phage head-tail connector protein n=1 Tax=Clostridium TaxID=1485 RepID=UPI000E06420A|nr:phage head-tail connector protein [Clostridium sporogenes]MCW6085576.1 phage head-tail connector protein [Clostridium sporogenes]STC76657.1 Phage QLRG family, putative DNA packaging [Clostridium botulinum]
MLEDIKELLSIKDVSKDKILNIYIRKATTLIKSYLNNDEFTSEYIQQNFKDAIIDIVVNAFNLKENKNIKALTQGSRSVTYADNTAFAITDSVANLLPMPYIRMW